MYTKFYFGNLKTRDVRFNLVLYIEWIRKEEGMMIWTGYSRPEDVLHRRHELDFIL
jgi:hypothetical protein